MAREYSAKGLELLEDLPPYEQESPVIAAIVNAVANELQRIEDFLSTVRRKLHPQYADDEYRTLALHEARLGLPVEPEGVSVSDRRAKVLAAARTSQAGAGEGWWQLVTLSLGTAAWSHRENTPNDYWLEISAPEESDSYSAGQLEALLRNISPAGLKLSFSFGEGFRVGISEVGDLL